MNTNRTLLKTLEMHSLRSTFFILITFFGVSSCQFQDEFEVRRTLRIDSDGPGKGKDTYEIFREALGPNSIESPDMFENDHNQRTHITEDYNDEVGNHFVFSMHLNKDGNRGEYNGTQRNEIKVYRESKEWIKGKKDETFRYRWKFKTSKGLKISDKFCHFFQLHPVGIGGHPMITLSGRKRPDGDFLELTYTELGKNNKTIILGEIDWDEINGHWLSISCQTTFSKAKDGGRLTMKIIRDKDQKKLLDEDNSQIDLWYDDHKVEKPYIRPKWGIVRSTETLKDTSRKTEKIRFSNFQIASMRPKK